MVPRIRKPNWNVEGIDWPNRAFSRFLRAGGVEWHVQVMGAGPPLLLLHGAGAATHSWRDLAPDLSRDFTVVAPDLPGHGFTETPPDGGLSLRGMVEALGALFTALGVRPEFIVGHSAGAAIGVRLRIDHGVGDGGLVSVNGALQPFPGAAGYVFPAMTKLLFLNPLANQMFAWRASRPGAVKRLIESTGSFIDNEGLEFYARLLGTTGHVDGALGMMANWDLHGLKADFARLRGPFTLLAAANDRAVPPGVADVVHAILPTSTVITLPGLGHLAHEEAPSLVADVVRRATGVSGAPTP